MRNEAINGVVNIFDKVLSQLNIIIVKKDTKAAKDTVEQAKTENTQDEIKYINTNKITQELKNRNITREEFLQFYKAGRDKVKENQRKILNQISLVEKEIGNIFLDHKNGENLLKELENPQISASRKIEVLEKIRKNVIGVERLHVSLQKWGLSREIITNSQCKNFEKFLTEYDKAIKTYMKGLEIQNIECQENIEIFNQEIANISDELQTIELAGKGYGKLESESRKEKELRAQQIKATIFGNEKLEREWDERVKRFYSHKVDNEEYTYIHRNADGTNEVRKIEYQTISDYKDFAEDAYFLNLEEYKKYLEAISMYESAEKKYGKGAGLEIIKKVTKFEGKEFQEFFSLKQNNPQKADEWLKQYVEDMREYVKTFHGFTNKYAVRAETWKTSGSTLKNMKPVRGDIPTSKKIANVTENIFRFFGIKKPEFYKVNPDGTKVTTPGKATITILADAGIVAGITTTAVLTGPIGIATWGAAYAAKGIVTAGNVIRGNIEYKKHKDVIDANLPTLGSYSNDDKEIIRKTYYREKLKETKGKELNLWNMFTTWAHAKSDRLFFRKNSAREVEEKYVANKIKLSNFAIDERTERTKENFNFNFNIAQQNQWLRQQDLIKNKGQRMTITSSLRDVSNKGNTVASTAISVEQKYKARQQYQDRVNKIWTLILTAGMKIGLDAIKTGFKEPITTQKEVSVEKKEIVQETQTTPGYKKWVEGSNTYKPVVGHRKVKELDVEQNIGELGYSKECASSIYEGYQTFTKNRSNSDDIVGIVLKAKDSNGMTVEVSLAKEGMGLTTNHVHSLTNVDISKLSIKDVIEQLKISDPENYKKYVDAIGLKENASAEEIGKIALEKGQFFKQSSKLEGWSEVLPGNVHERTETFLQGMQEVHNPGHWEQLPDITKVVNIEKTVRTVEKINETNEVFSTQMLGKTTLGGLEKGVIIGSVDQIHDGLENKNGQIYSDFEEKTKHFFTSKIVASQAEKIRQSIISVEKLKREASERKKQAKREYRSR